MLEFSWDGSLIWSYEPPEPAHHDVERLDNGNTPLLCHEAIPEECKMKIDDMVK